MSEVASGDAANDAFLALKAHAEGLERQLREAESTALLSLRDAELKAEALRAGIVDLDGLRLLDPTQRQSETFNAAEVVARLRREKAWLFGAGSSSSSAALPAVSPARKRLAMDMSLDEWRAARAELLRRR